MSVDPMTERNDERGRPPGTNIANYTPATRAQRLGEADKALQEELEKDSGVQAARATLEQAQAKLTLAQQYRNTVPWAPYERRNDQRHRDWQNAVQAVQEAKGAVAVAEKAYHAARNDAAASRTSARFRTEEDARRKRQEAEQERHAMLEEATALADAVTASGVAAIAEGVRECDVAGEAMRTLFRLGGEYAHVMTPFVASGEHMSPPHRISSDKLIRNGDLVFIDIGANWNGYFGDVARTTICGRPSRQQQEIFTAVYEAMRAGITKMRPCCTNQDAAQAIIQTAEKYNLGKRFLSLFIGHGVGIGANEPPYIGETLPGAPVYEFQPGMVFAVEPLIWVEGVRGGGGVRLEEMVLITDGDAHVMSRAPFEEKLLLT